jgi:RimJ/RimL family protein N-acetyltransferase
MVRLLEQLFAIEDDFKFNAQKHRLAFIEIIKDSHCGCKVAENKQGNVIGMCSAQWVYSTSTGNKSAWVEDLVVEEAFRGHQIGEELLTRMTQWCKDQGCGRVQLAYDVENKPAITFYEKHHFSKMRLGVFTKLLNDK